MTEDDKIKNLLEALATGLCSAHQNPDPDCGICYPRDNVSRGWMVLAKIYERRMLEANKLLSSSNASPEEIKAHLENCSREKVHEEYMEDLGLGLGLGKPKNQ